MISQGDFFKRRIHIDEDGYPLVDGLRLDDQESLHEIFLNLRRLRPDDHRSPLMTTWGGVGVSVESFSSPIVIQSVDALSDGFYAANLFSGLKFKFSSRDLQIDEWNRLHLYLGSDQIEATFSRKAQAELLPCLGDDLTLTPFRKNFAAVEYDVYWNEAYGQGRDAWDLGKVSPSFEAVVARWLIGDKLTKRILVPGAGRGFEAEWLASKGHDVTAEDFSSRVQEEFFRIHTNPLAKFRVEDFFSAVSANDTEYDAIAELIFYCAINPERRKSYFEQVYRRLKPGGLLVGIFYISYGPGGPPYSTTLWELRAHAQHLFHVKHWQMSQHSVPARMGKEFEVVLQKRLA